MQAMELTLSAGQLYGSACKILQIVSETIEANVGGVG
jgi:hypothetical protein